MECAQNVILSLGQRQREPTFFPQKTTPEIAVREKNRMGTENLSWLMNSIAQKPSLIDQTGKQ